MIVGAVAGLAPDALRPWCASARKAWKGPIVLLCGERPLKYQPLARDYGIARRWAKELDKLPGVCMIARDRWKALADFLNGCHAPLDTPVVFADTRDVVFQSNPVACITDKLVVGTEGKRHDENAWCAGWLNELAPEWNDRLLPADVLNAGVIGGPLDLLARFALALYNAIPETPCTCTAGATHMTDQTFLNILARDGFAPETEITRDWVFHVRSQEHQRIPAVWHEDRKQLLREDGEPFPIVHQWDLADQLAPIFQEMR